MANELAESDMIELRPSSFKFHDFSTSVCEVRISCRIIKMEDSLYVWVGDFEDSKMNDLTVAMPSKYEKLPVATKIMGMTEDSTSTSLAKRLTKKCGKPVFVSFNVAVNNLTLPVIEKAIQDEFNTQKHLLVF
ncbi:proteasome assembly chaperone 4 [Venturia canescens]|uniref:proteasome assembly chaperone 4 n=1 Tax=Venturia canescens TaxID=32260 RepID=UPI001C9C1B10|nr:proteasome assembly chaperone 4-like [Venturia canescens]